MTSRAVAKQVCIAELILGSAAYGRGAAENIERGMAKDEGRRRAYVKFGSARRIREEVWRGNSFLRGERLWGDLCYVVRMLRKAPPAVLTVMVSLSLGIAANVVVFSGVNKIVLQGRRLEILRS